MARSPQESEQSLTDLVIAQPDSAELRGRLGLLYQSTGRQRLALAEFCAAFTVAPADTVGRYNYAAALHAAVDRSPRRGKDCVHEIRRTPA